MSAAAITAAVPLSEEVPLVSSSFTPAQIADAEAKLARPALVDNKRDANWITNNICAIIEQPAPWWWWLAMLIAVPMASLVPISLIYLVATGIGVWGSHNTVAWAWDITNFVWWVGIAHAGTLISAILCVTRQKWRTSINRAGEAVTIFSWVCAGLYPAIHVGRQWDAWFLAPLPNHHAIWPNFKSPLLWDVFAVTAYGTVSFLFWYMGMIPDLGTIRDRAYGWRKKIYGVLALGWHGSSTQWKHYEMAYLILAGIGTPLVIAVTTIVASDFATSVVPGWHATIFPIYFLSGATFSGFATVLLCLIPLRELYPQLKDVITRVHMDNLVKVMLVCGSAVLCIYATEHFMAYYSANPYERGLFMNRMFTGYYVPFYWIMMFCNIVIPLTLWFPKVRANYLYLFFACIMINIGMWFERFLIIAASISYDFLPSSWAEFHPTISDISLFVGTLGTFALLFLLFVRFLPFINMAEVKSILPSADPHRPKDDAGAKH
jgi:Ni/Fe-hydrogenase subunit HybB-like protein